MSLPIFGLFNLQSRKISSNLGSVAIALSRSTKISKSDNFTYWTKRNIGIWDELILAMMLLHSGNHPKFQARWSWVHKKKKFWLVIDSLGGVTAIFMLQTSRRITNSSSIQTTCAFMLLWMSGSWVESRMQY